MVFYTRDGAILFAIRGIYDPAMHERNSDKFKECDLPTYSMKLGGVEDGVEAHFFFY
jgi:hypothetical protein